MHVKRWMGIGGVVAAVLYAACIRAGSEPGVSCGLGLPPDASGFAEAEAREAAELKKNGFLRVCETNLERFDISFRPMDVAEAGLAFQPVDLARTPFARFKSIGGRAESISGTRSRLYRSFRMPDGHTLTLSEHDMSADGTNSWRDPKNEPERIKGMPARLSVFQAPSGKAISHLSWKEGRRDYELWLDANVAREPLRDQLFALAASLPDSIPACPNEPPPRSARLGPDGRPVDEPPPAMLTKEAFEARFESARPCK